MAVTQLSHLQQDKATLLNRAMDNLMVDSPKLGSERRARAHPISRAVAVLQVEAMAALPIK